MHEEEEAYQIPNIPGWSCNGIETLFFRMKTPSEKYLESHMLMYDTGAPPFLESLFSIFGGISKLMSDAVTDAI